MVVGMLVVNSRFVVAIAKPLGHGEVKDPLRKSSLGIKV
jgi:hypothetical protein